MIEVDVAVIGGGVVGCAVARELAGYQLSLALLEAGGDVGGGLARAYLPDPREPVHPRRPRRK